MLAGKACLLVSIAHAHAALAAEPGNANAYKVPPAVMLLAVSTASSKKAFKELLAFMAEAGPALVSLSFQK